MLEGEKKSGLRIDWVAFGRKLCALKAVSSVDKTNLKVVVSNATHHSNLRWPMQLKHLQLTHDRSLRSVCIKL